MDGLVDNETCAAATHRNCWTRTVTERQASGEEEAAEELGTRRWRASALIPFPWHFQAVPGTEAPDGGLPGQLAPASRIPAATDARYGDVIVSTRTLGEDSALPDAPLGFQYGLLSFTTDAGSAASALERVAPALELVLDDLVFQLQSALSVLQLEIIDVSAPLAEGEEREMLLMPFPHGYQQWKFSQSTALGDARVAIVPRLEGNYAALQPRTQQALDWYIKGLNAPVDADRFIFFWVALEVLEHEVGVDVLDVYTAICGHQVSECPQCGRSTERRVAGQSIRGLLESIGIDAGIASRLWKMRQMVHGAKSFRPGELQDVGELLQVLRSAVMDLLKSQLGIPPDAPPLVGHGAPAFGATWFQRRRALVADDLD
jgi:hypothetical protein